MKSLMEIYTVQIKLLQGWRQEISQRHLSMRSFMEQVTKSSELSAEGLKAMEERLKIDFSSVSQVLQNLEKEWTMLLKRVTSKDSTKESSSSGKSTPH